ncbi:MAG: hypothetical protein N3A58_01775 [Spirochaetes bacterium]|nr:hypothetical protein [Spirochaetota bacterium]
MAELSSKDFYFVQKIKLNKLLLISTIILLTVLSYLITSLFHLLNLPVFAILPLHWLIYFFTLIFGWEITLPVAIFAPLFSFFISGRPIFPILIFISLELATYSLIADLLFKKYFYNSKLKNKFLFSFIFIFISSIAGKIIYIISNFIFSIIYNIIRNSSNQFNLIQILKSFLIGLFSSSILIIFFSILFYYRYKSKN